MALCGTQLGGEVAKMSDSWALGQPTDVLRVHLDADVPRRTTPGGMFRQRNPIWVIASVTWRPV